MSDEAENQEDKAWRSTRVLKSRRVVIYSHPDKAHTYTLDLMNPDKIDVVAVYVDGTLHTRLERGSDMVDVGGRKIEAQSERRDAVSMRYQRQD